MSDNFQEELAKLNEQQRLAVQTLDGAVLVVAGPGTGKTQLLSMRVANILKSTDARPSNILCLTFTNKAAVNMSERIIRLAGSEGAKIAISTFHSFSAEIMNTYPDYFWNAASLSVAPESVQLDIIESIVAELPLDNPLAMQFAGQYTLLGDIQRSIGLAKDAGLTPDKLQVILRGNLAYIDEVEETLSEILEPRLSAKNLKDLQEKVSSLPTQDIDKSVYPLLSLSTVLTEGLAVAIEADEPTGKTANTGNWKKRWVQTENGSRGMHREHRINNWWLALADVYDAYRSALHQRGFYDYADMLVEVISQVEQNPNMLADIQERFSYVLIDEFQDTNPAQLRLAHLVADHQNTEGNPNLMAVGDDDQSIFKFNGAVSNNMLGFRRTYKQAKTIILTKNYRSTQKILDAAKNIIEQAQSRLVNSAPDLNKNLIAVSPPNNPGEVKAVAYKSRELQLSEVARQIQSSYNPDMETVILARGHDSLIRMAGILQHLDVPVRYEQASNILDHEIVKQTYLIAQLLLAIIGGDRTLSDSLIHQIIRAPHWGIKPRVLWDLAVNNYPNKNWLESLLNSGDSQLESIGEWFVDLAAACGDQPLAVTIEQILGLRPVGDFTSPIKDFYTSGQGKDTNSYFHALSAIQLLRSLVHEFGKSSKPTLQELVRFIEINRQNNKIIADESPFVTGDHAVRLLTVHKAKGLEFDQVYIIDATEDNWQPRKSRRSPPSNLPLQPAGDDFDDYVRLMYVALTRAKSGVNISSYYQDHAGKDVAVSSIIQSALKVEKIAENDKSKLIEVLEENLTWPALSGGEEKEILKARLDTYNLSVTHLLNFLDLAHGGPEHFKQRNLLHLPEAKSASLGYGTAMHAALETAQKLTGKNSFTLEAVNNSFKKSLLEQQLPEMEVERLMPKGERTLKRLFNDFKLDLQESSLAEYKINNARLGAARIRGKIDRLDMSDDTLNIVDYKTGNPLASFDTRDKTKMLKAHNHKTQLIFYALLASQQSSLSRYSKVQGQMVYLQAEKQSDLIRSYSPTPDDTSRLQKLIEAVWQKIINYDLPDVSSYDHDINGVLKFEQDLIDGRI